MKIVKLLVEKRANINVYSISDDEKISTPLIEACQNNKFAVIKYLVENKADINDEMSISSLLLFNNGMTSFMTAVKKCELKIVKYLVDNGADIHATSIPLLLIDC